MTPTDLTARPQIFFGLFQSLGLNMCDRTPARAVFQHRMKLTFTSSAFFRTTRLAEDWFPVDERDVATTAANMANAFGTTFFVLVPPLLVPTADVLDRILWIQVPMNALAVGAAWLLLEERPPTPPSASAAALWREQADAAEAARARGSSAAAAGLAAVIRDIRSVLKNRNFNYQAAGFSICIGTVWTILILEAQLIQPCGYSEFLTGGANALMVGTGVVAAFGLAKVTSRTRAFHPLQRATVALAVLATWLMLAATRPGQPGLLLIAYVGVGCTLQPLLPLAMEHAAEMTYPVRRTLCFHNLSHIIRGCLRVNDIPNVILFFYVQLNPEISTTVLFTGANLVCALFVAVLSPLLRLPASANCTSAITPANGFLAGAMVIGLACNWAVKKDYRRQLLDGALAGGTCSGPAAAPEAACFELGEKHVTAGAAGGELENAGEAAGAKQGKGPRHWWGGDRRKKPAQLPAGDAEAGPVDGDGDEQQPPEGDPDDGSIPLASTPSRGGVGA